MGWDPDKVDFYIIAGCLLEVLVDSLYDLEAFSFLDLFERLLAICDDLGFDRPQARLREFCCIDLEC